MKAFEVWWNAEPLDDGCPNCGVPVPEKVWRAALEWAKSQVLMGDRSDVLREIEKELENCSFPSLQGNGCKLCGQKHCAVRRYESTLEDK